MIRTEGDRKTMNLKEQQYVCELAKCQNLTKAAQNLYISQPALSLYLNNLENNLGVKLFERVGKRFVLTYIGERYVEAAQKMLALNDGFDRELQEYTENYSGRISIGMQSRRSTYFIPPLIAAFEKEYPKVLVDIFTGNYAGLCEKAEKNELDLLIWNLSEDMQMPSMEVYPLLDEMILIAVPACHPLNEKAIYVPDRRYRYLDPVYLEGETLIVQKPGQSLRRDVDSLLKKHGITAGRFRELESIETAMQFVAENLGIGFNREGYSFEMSYNKRINYYGVLGEDDTVKLVLAHRKGLPLTTPVKRMLEMIQSHAKAYYRQE